jgi:Flp pilus assembly protein TadG
MRIEGRGTRVTARSLARSGTAPTGRFRGDSGAILAEAALITPLFIVIIFGILEFGGLFRDYLTLSNTATVATRQAAISGDSSSADGEILNAIRKASRAVPRNQIELIVIWHATGPTDTVPAVCKSGTPVAGTAPNFTGACNVYKNTGTQWWTYNATNLSTCTVSSPQKFWCPTDRKTAVKDNAGAGPDYLGVYIKLEHPWITGLFGQSVTIDTTSITKLESTRLL